MKGVKKMRKILTMIILSSMLFAIVPFTANALTEGDWEYVIQNNEITITDYNGESSNVIVPEYIKGFPVTAIKINDTRGFRTILESGHLPDSVREIGEGSFWGCNNLKSINFPKSLKTIGDDAFAGCPLEIVDLTYVENLGTYAFRNCHAKSVELPRTITSIPDGLFSGAKLKQVNIPNTVKSIGGYAFSDCDIDTVIIPGSVEVIGGTAFGGCKSLKSVIISYGTTTLEIPRVHTKNNGTFVGSSSLEAVYIPATVTTIPKWFVSGLDNVIIYCSENSYAEELCKRENISYIIDNSVNSSIHVLYNGERISFHNYGQNPEIIGGRTMVPLRSIFEALGASVEWDNSTQTVTAVKGNTKITLQIGSSEMYVNGVAKALDVPATLINSRTMVPVRAVSEAFNCNVEWNNDTRTVAITK